MVDSMFAQVCFASTPPLHTSFSHSASVPKVDLLAHLHTVGVTSPMMKHICLNMYGAMAMTLWIDRPEDDGW